MEIYSITSFAMTMVVLWANSRLLVYEYYFLNFAQQCWDVCFLLKFLKCLWKK